MSLPNTMWALGGGAVTRSVATFTRATQYTRQLPKGNVSPRTTRWNHSNRYVTLFGHQTLSFHSCSKKQTSSDGYDASTQEYTHKEGVHASVPPSQSPEQQEQVSDDPLPGARHGGEKFAMLMTCTVCDTRSAKVISKQAYYEGLVLARCPGCENLHLIADRLGWFEDGGIDVQQILEQQGRGDEFSQQTVGSEGGVLELTMDDWKAIKSSDKSKFTNSDEDGQRR